MKLLNILIFSFIINSAFSQIVFTDITADNTSNSGYPYNGVLKIRYDNTGNKWMIFSDYFNGGPSNYSLGKFNGQSWEYFDSNNSSFSIIYDFTFDSYNNLWLSDLNTIWKYDGSNWIDASIYGIPQIPYFKCCSDASGNVYFETFNNGVIKLFDTSYVFINNSNSGLLSDYPTSLFIDNQQQLWIGHWNGVSIYNGINCSTINQSGGNFQDITQDNNGNMWFALSTGITKYDGTNWTYYDPSQLFSYYYSLGVNSISSDNNGNIWCGTFEQGIYHFDGTTWVSIRDGQGLNTDFIWDIYCDTDKTWVCTKDMGVNIFENNQWTYVNTLDGMLSNGIRTMDCSSDGSLWLGTKRGVIQHKNNTWTNYFYKYGEPNTQYYAYYNNYIITTICNGLNNKIWFGGYCGYPNGAAYYKDSTFVEFPWDYGSQILEGSIYQILEDSADVTWFATENALNKMEILPNFTFPQWTAYKTQDGLLDNKTTALLRDYSGNLIIGTWSGINVYDGNVFTSISMTPVHNQITEHITALIEDTLNQLWVGTTNGLGCFDGQNWTVYDTSTGLAGNYITSLYLTADSTLWVSTNNGISWFNGTIFSSYYKSDGLIADSITDIVEDLDGNMYFSSMYGLSKVSANNRIDEIKQKTKLSLFPNPASTSIKVSAKEIINSIELYNLNGVLLRTISCNRNVQTLDISDLSTGSYFVRIFGSDKTWVEKFVVIR